MAWGRADRATFCAPKVVGWNLCWTRRSTPRLLLRCYLITMKAYINHWISLGCGFLTCELGMIMNIFLNTQTGCEIQMGEALGGRAPT